MARRKPPPKPDPLPRRRRGYGSVTILKTGVVRSRMPSPSRKSKDFPPGQMVEAVAWLDAMLAPATAEPIASAVTLAEWGGTWHQTYVAPIRPPNTVKWSLYALGKLSHLYTLELIAVRASMLQATVGTLSATLGPATVQAIVGVWRRCFTAAVDDELLTRNPAARLTLPRAVPRQVKRHVTAAEVALLWPKIVGQRFEAAFALLLGCGLRIGEVLGLRWEHVDFRRHRVWIQFQWTNSHFRDLPKGRNPHWARLPPAVEAALIRHQGRQPAGAVFVLQSPHDSLFGPGPRGRRKPQTRPWSAQMIRNDLTAIVKDLGLDEMTPHAARRGLVSALLDGGVSPAVVAEIAGHADQATTLRSYAGRNDDARARAAEVVDRYLGGDLEDDFSQSG